MGGDSALVTESHSRPGMIPEPRCPSVPDDKLNLMYGTITSFNILMQNFYMLHQARMESVSAFVSQLEEALNVVQ